MKKIVLFIIIMQSILGVLFLTSCKEDELTQMARLYKKEYGMDYIQEDHFSLGEYDECKVVLFHTKHPKDSWSLDVDKYISIGDHILPLPCYTVDYAVYNEETQEIKDLEEAYQLGWINDEEMEIIKEKNGELIKYMRKELGCY